MLQQRVTQILFVYIIQATSYYGVPYIIFQIILMIQFEKKKFHDTLWVLCLTHMNEKLPQINNNNV